MNVKELQRLAQLIRKEAGTLLDTWRREVRKLPSAQHLSIPTLNDHIPSLLNELADAFESRTDVSIAEALIEGTPPAHGEQRVVDGFDIVEVVAEYNILRGCIHDLAVANNLNLAGNAFHILNRVFDGAIGLAVEAYATQRAKEVQHRREEYLAFVAHDLRTPLNAISLATSALEANLIDHHITADSARMIKTLHRNVGQLQAMVKKVLDEQTDLESEKGVKVELRRLDLWPLVEALIHDIKPVGGADRTVLINNIPEDLECFADAGLLRRIFQNLISNAITYTPHGEVRIGAQMNETDGLLECWVEDTGKGIPPHLLERVFLKGEGDDERDESSGLGLAIVKAFVEAHKGEVKAESMGGRGSTFRFTLPLEPRGVLA